MAWTMRLPEAEEAELNELAVAQGRSKQEVARDAVRVYLMRNRQWPTSMFTDEDDSFDFGGPIGKDEIRDIMNRTV